MLVNDIQVSLNIRVGLDILFNLGKFDGGALTDNIGNGVTDSLGNLITIPLPSFLQFNPSEGDYYSITDGVATLIKNNIITDNLGNDINDNLGNNVTI